MLKKTNVKFFLQYYTTKRATDSHQLLFLFYTLQIVIFHLIIYLTKIIVKNCKKMGGYNEIITKFAKLITMRNYTPKITNFTC